MLLWRMKMRVGRLGSRRVEKGDLYSCFEYLDLDIKLHIVRIEYYLMDLTFMLYVHR